MQNGWDVKKNKQKVISLIRIRIQLINQSQAPIKKMRKQVGNGNTGSKTYLQWHQWYKLPLITHENSFLQWPLIVVGEVEGNGATRVR